MCFTEVIMRLASSVRAEGDLKALVFDNSFGIYSEKSIKLDKYVLPFSQVELCQIAMEEGDINEARSRLDKAWYVCTMC